MRASFFILALCAGLSFSLSQAEIKIQNHLKHFFDGKDHECDDLGDKVERLTTTGYGTCSGVCQDRFPERLVLREAYCDNCIVRTSLPEQYTCVCCVEEIGAETPTPTDYFTFSSEIIVQEHEIRDCDCWRGGLLIEVDEHGRTQPVTDEEEICLTR